MRVAVAAAGVLGLAVAAACGPATPKPDRPGIFVERGGELVPLPREQTRSYALAPWVKIADSRPRLVFNHRGVDVASVRFVRARPDGSCGRDGRCTESVDLDIQQLDEGMYALRPGSPLQPDVYALVLKEGPGQDEVASFQVLEPPAMSAEELVSKHLEAVGGGELESLRLAGETRLRRGNFPAAFGYAFEMECARPHSIRHRVQTQSSTIAGYDGERAWIRRDLGVEAEVLPEADWEHYRRQALECLNRGLVPYEDVEVLGRDSRGDRPLIVVGATLRGEPVLAYLDAESYLIVKSEGRRLDGRHAPWTNRYAGFAEVDGVTVAMRTAYSAEGSSTTTRITKFEPNVPIDPERFRTP